ncbi:MAG: acetate--CoA ligase family protein [Burkholderiales bacterium]|nr:acetate--CoA ligase family protein [Burkholderiales bacterium]
MQDSTETNLDALFNPASVAVVGATNDVGRIGGVPLDLMIRRGYRGRILPINPKYAEIQGLPAYPSLAAVGAPVDLVVVAVNAAAVPQTLEDAIAAGAKGMVLFSSGFAEADEAGRAAQQALAARARAAGVRLLGPNCLGLMAFASNVYATFSPAPRAGESKQGDIAIVSQSGAFGAFAYSLARIKGLGMSYWLTTGNEADIEFADCVAWLANDPATRVILGYIEGCRDGAKLKRALAAARAAGKRVVITKVGRSALGSAAAASHTAALTGEDAVYDAMFRQYGVWRARTVEELFTVGYAASMCAAPASRRIGLLTTSGGVGVLMADEAVDCGLDVAEMPAAAQAALRAKVSFAGPRNPVDITGQHQNHPELLGETLENMLGRGPDQGRYDSLLFFPAAGLLGSPRAQVVVDALIAAHRRHPDVPLGVNGLARPEQRAQFEAAGIPVLEEPSGAVRAFGALAFMAESARRAAARAPIALPAVAPLPAHALTEIEALRLLRDAGLPAMPCRHAASADEAAAAAAALGFPVVVKLSSRTITHKSDVGGVRLDLADAAAVRAAFDAVTASARRADPAAHVDGVLVAPMIRGGVECILGVQRDPVFGPVVMFGLGGVLVEALKDVSFRVAPIDEAEARAMVDEIRARRVLDGMRGAPPADVDALAAAIAALSRFAAAHADRLESLDLNPFVVLPRDGPGVGGARALALDAVLIARS